MAHPSLPKSLTDHVDDFFAAIDADDDDAAKAAVHNGLRRLALLLDPKCTGEAISTDAPPMSGRHGGV